MATLDTLACVIDENGCWAPIYADVLQSLQESFKAIFGQDVYIDPDSQDGQLLAVFAKAISDTNDATVGVYNSYAPSTSVGAGLSSVVKINGIRRKIPSNSQAMVTLVGQAGTIIYNGVVADNLQLGTQWSLPLSVMIPDSGYIEVQCVCQQFGAIQADANTLTVIQTPTPGWQTATNPGAAIVGKPVETDAELRRRQHASVAIPAQSVLDSIVGNVWALPNVVRVKGWENPTDLTDPVTNLPPHSIGIVVAGGGPQQICQTIAQTKCPGVVTTGDVVRTIIDPYGVPSVVRYWSLIQEMINVTITIKPLVNFNTGTTGVIRGSVMQFINTLDIGETCFLNRLFAPANLSGDAATGYTMMPQSQLDVLRDTYNVVSITQGLTAPGTAADIPIAMNQAAVTDVNHVSVTVLT